MKIPRILGGVLVASITALSITAVPGPAAAACAKNFLGKSDCKGPTFARVGTAAPAQQRWERGDRIPRTVIVQQVHYVDYDLPRPEPGYSYVAVGDDIYLLADATRRVVEPIVVPK